MTNKSNHALWAIGFILMLSSCYEFESIQQPETAVPGSTFDIDISVSVNVQSGGEMGGEPSQSYYSILLPEDWESTDSINYTGDLNGVYHYSAIISATLGLNALPPIGYTWWTYVSSDTVDSLVGTVSFTQTIQTDVDPGLYYIDYRLGHATDPVYPILETDEMRPIWVGADPAPIEADVFVSPEGSDANSGLSWDEPLKTITAATLRIVTDSLTKRTIFLADGEYKASNNGEFFPIRLASNLSLVGTSQSGVIIDAEEQHIVILINSVVSDTIKNMTVKGGACCDFQTAGSWGGVENEYGGGGLFVAHSEVYLENLLIRDNTSDTGGGIFTEQSNLSLKNVSIIDNTAEHSGGGINFGEMGQNIRDTLEMVDCVVSGNYSGSGGGGISLTGKGWFENVYLANNSTNNNGGALEVGWNQGNGSFASLSNVTMTGNSAVWGGALFIVTDSDVEFSATNRCNIFSNTASLGSDLGAAYGVVNQHVVLDTFTVMQPTDHHAAPISKFSFDILNAKFQQIDQDVYVSTLGANSNSGTTAADPLKNISYANSIIMGIHTIYIADGIYSPSTTGEAFPLSLASGISLMGESQEGVVLDAEGQADVIDLYHDNTTISHLTITGGGCGIKVGQSSNLNLESTTISGNTARGMTIHGGGVTNLADVTIVGNSGGSGGGIMCYGVVSMEHVILAQNTAESGGALWLVGNDAGAALNHVTIADNVATGNGGGIRNLASITMTNSILRNNLPDQYYESHSGAYINIDHSNIQGGTSQLINESGEVNWLEGNIATDALFCNSWESDYHLAESSPCLGSGQDGSDMGALGVGCLFPVAVDDEDNSWPSKFALNQNYPNPFNPTTTINYDLPEQSKVRLTVFDVRGQEVATLQDSDQAPGHYEVQWNGMNDSGDLISTGLYFCRLEAGAYTKTIKMIYLK